MATARVGDVGTVIRLTILDCTTQLPLNLTGGTVAVRIRKPCGSLLTKTGVIDADPTTGIVTYTTVAGDLDSEGVYKAEAVPDLPDGSWTSTPDVFPVEGTI